MIGKTFPRGGGHIPHRKGGTDRKPITVLTPPQEVVIPLQQHIGAPCEALVAPGDKVALGQKVGEGKAFVSAPVHASVSGTVKAVEERPLLDGRKVMCVVIENDGQDRRVQGSGQDWKSLSPEQIKQAVKEAGLVGMGGAGFPTHVKLASPKPIDTVIINGAECEPYLTCDHRLMVERGEQLLTGLKIIMKAVGAQKGILGIEVNKQDAIDTLQELVGSEDNIEICPLQVRYPQGAEKQLIKAAVNREVPSGAIPFEVGCLVSNVHTAISTFETISQGVGLYQRVVTVSGKCCVEPRNILARIGTPLQDLILFCGGYYQEPAVIVGGGPMTGPSVTNVHGPVVKNLSGILLLADDEIALDENRPCIRCARCVDECPMGLTPNALGLLSNKDKLDEAVKLNLFDCIECGLCSFVCPAKRGLVTWIKEGKQKYNAKKAKEKAV